MALDDPDSDVRPVSELIRQRLHRAIEMIQTHEAVLAEHKLILQMWSKDRDVFATREQLDHAIRTALTEVTAAHDHIGLKLEHLRKELEPIRSGVTWLVSLILAAVVTALLGLVILR